MSGGPTRLDQKLAIYREARTELPDAHWLWPLYGAGLENLGVKDRPIQVETPSCGPHQLLVCHDAVGLCFSDTKVIKAGASHPRLGGSDMRSNPVVLGHEVALTVVQVGEVYAGQFKPGDRFLIQADIYYKGVGLAYGYALQGGLSQYNLIGKEVLEGDEGCYLIPLQPATGYAQAALTEPWACVLASYNVKYRTAWKPGGAVLIVAGPGATGGYELGTPYADGQPPETVVLAGVAGSLRDALMARATAGKFKLTELPPLNGANVAKVLAASGQDGFDDIVYLGANAALYELGESVAAKGCMHNLVGAEALSEPAQVDVGRLHYDHIGLTGTDERVISAAYKPIRTELRPNGCVAFLGAAGPMGQMHFQRALQSAQSPRLIVATDLVRERLDVLKTKFGQLIEAASTRHRAASTRHRAKDDATTVTLRTPGDQAPDVFNAGLVRATGGVGFDDIVVLAQSAAVVAGAVGMLAPNGVMNIFAGLPRGTRAAIDLRAIITKGIRFTGASGSSIHDLRVMLEKTEGGQLDPNLSVAAVSGFNDIKKGLDGVIHQRYPGKVVIYPQVLDFPLTALSDLRDVLPHVYARLGPNQTWTVEAETEFLKELLP